MSEGPPPAADDLPRAPGAYLVIVALSAASAFPVPRPSGCRLDPGVYAYIGSGRGPGGIRARVARHLRADKRLRWHIDHVVAAGRVCDVLVWPGGNECRWRAALTANGASVPVRGLGSSDCRRCPAHLLRLPAGTWRSIAAAPIPTPS